MQEGRSAARTLTKASITIIRPNRKFNAGARIARTMKNPKNSDHGRLLHQREEAQSGRHYGDRLV